MATLHHHPALHSGKYVIDTTEKATFKGDTAVHSETHATYSPPLYGVSESTMIMDQEYLGSCPAGIATRGYEGRGRENYQYLETLKRFTIGVSGGHASHGAFPQEKPHLTEAR